jgi:hypothetical protein
MSAYFCPTCGTYHGVPVVAHLSPGELVLPMPIVGRSITPGELAAAVNEIARRNASGDIHY